MPEAGTLPAGWHAQAIPVRLQAGALTYVEIPLVPAGDAGPEPAGTRAFAAEAGPGGMGAAAVLKDPGGVHELELYYRNPGDQPTVEQVPWDSADLSPAADVLLPLGWPWSGPVDLYVAAHQWRGARDGLHGAVIAGGPSARAWGLQLVNRRPTWAAGLLWRHEGDDEGGADVASAHWQVERGRTRLAAQGLWQAGTSGSWPPAAWGVAATAPLGHSWHMEGAYRWADPALSAPWLEGVPAPGWTVGVGWRSESGAEWRTALGITTGPGVDWEVAGRVGPWHVRQGLVAGGAWRPATSIGVQVPGTGLWLGLRAEEQAPLGWQLGGRAGKWTWSLHGGDAARGEARLGWQGTGPLATHWRIQATASAAAGTGSQAPSGILSRLGWRLDWERPGDDGSGWQGRWLWRPHDPDVTAAAAVGWRSPWTGDSRWCEGEILWEREAAGEAWEARLGGRWPWGDEGELAGQLLVRRAWRAGPGVLYTGQVSLAGARRLAGAWHGLGGLRWWTQWSDAGGLGGTGAELELGLSRELGSGWRLSAGWRWPLGPEPDGGGPFARVEWRPAAGSGPRPGGQDAAAALPAAPPGQLPSAAGLGRIGGGSPPRHP